MHTSIGVLEPHQCLPTPDDSRSQMYPQAKKQLLGFPLGYRHTWLLYNGVELTYTGSLAGMQRDVLGHCWEV